MWYHPHGPIDPDAHNMTWNHSSFSYYPGVDKYLIVTYSSSSWSEPAKSSACTPFPPVSSWSFLISSKLVIMGCESGWDVIYGKAVYTISVIDAVSRGLFPCIRSAIEVSPSLQNQCLLSLIQRAMSEQMQSTFPDSITVSSKKQKIEVDSTIKVVTTKSIVDDNVSDVERIVVDEIITKFVTTVAEWTENEKHIHRKRLSRIDVIRYRKEWADTHAMDDFDVEDDDASCWKKCDEKDWDDMTNYAEYMKKDFEAMIMQLSRVLVGTVSADVTYDIKYGYDGDASILTVDAKHATGCTYLSCHHDGTSAFKFKPSFFDVPPGDVRSIKFVSNLLGLDDSATVKDLQDQHPNYSPGRYGWRKRAPEKKDDDEEDGMRGNDPAWIMVSTVYTG
jgi:hypothetical protein